MKILLCHNYYQQPGGEDQVYADEGELLVAAGHDVTRYEADNDSIAGRRRLSLVRDTLWNRTASREIEQIVRRRRIDVVHFHNTFPLLSPAAYYGAHRGGAAVVQTLHNFRLVCPGANLLRDDRPCDQCLGRAVAWPGVVHACYRNSRGATAVVAAMLALHRALGTWRKVDAYIALTEFARQTLAQGGLPLEKIYVKPSFLPVDPGPGDGSEDYAIYVGRLSAEKGIATLLRAWSLVPGALRLVLIGEGPMSDAVRRATAADPRIQWLGRRSPSEVLEIMGRAACLVLPSHCFEAFPRVLVEAFAKGTPAMVPRHGAMSEIVEEGVNGWHFAPRDAADLAARLSGVLANPASAARLRSAARETYLARYCAEANVRRLVEVYAAALGRSPRAADGAFLADCDRKAPALGCLQEKEA